VFASLGVDVAGDAGGADETDGGDAGMSTEGVDDIAASVASSRENSTYLV
jgi:hypothetical protein